MEVGKMKRIKVGSTETLVSDRDYPKLKKYTWFLNRGYAATEIKGKHFKLHQLLIKAKIIDHKNGNPLDNRRRRRNLRKCTASQNSWNSRPHKDSKIKFKGVSLTKGKYVYYRAAIQGQLIGYFDCPKKAARAYNNEAIKRFGKFAWTNPGV